MPLIAIEGVDYSGKSTLIQSLKDFYKTKKTEPLFLFEPGGTPEGDQAREILSTNDSLSELETAKWFGISRDSLFEQITEAALRQNKLVIYDRFILSSIAYQLSGNDHKPDDYMYKEVMNKLVQPFVSKVDANIVLDISMQTLKQRRGERDKHDVLDDKPDAFYERVIDAYRDPENVKLYKEHLIDGTRDEKRILSDVTKLIRKEFGQEFVQ